MGLHYTEYKLTRIYCVLKKKKPQFTEPPLPHTIILNVIYNYIYVADEKIKMKRLNYLPKPPYC